jgi:Ca2+-binding EF-hand superfamily protein
MGVVCLAESGERNAETRAGKIFDIMDFDSAGHITVDELVSDVYYEDMLLF